MFLFLLVLMPAFVVFCCVRTQDRAVVISSIISTVAGITACVLLAVFSFMHRITPFDFLGNFIYLNLKIYLLPMCLFYAAYFFLFKDSLEFRVRTFFSSCAAFFSFYMPYCIIASSPVSFFEIFLKPVLLLSMLLICADCINEIYEGYKFGRKKTIIVSSVIALFASLIPAALESFWILGFLILPVYVLSLLYFFLALILFMRSVKKADGFML